jgi:hypothetical protein
MAFSNGIRSISAVAAASLATRQFHIVELTANPNEVDLAAAKKGYGVVQNHPNSGEAATVAVAGETRCRAGATIAVGQYITSAATGYATSVDSASTSVRVVGRAKTAAASGSMFTLEIGRFATSVLSAGAVL